MERLDLSKYEGIAPGQYRSGRETCEYDGYIWAEDGDVYPIGEVRGWRHLFQVYGLQVARQMQDATGRLFADSPALLDGLAEAYAEIDQLQKELKTARAVLDTIAKERDFELTRVQQGQAEIDRLKARATELEGAYDNQDKLLNTYRVDLDKANTRIAELEAERDELQRKGESLCEQNGMLLVERHDMQALLDRCLDMLRVLQWRTDGDMPPEFCPYCDCRKEYGHDLNCPIAALICTLEAAVKPTSRDKTIGGILACAKHGPYRGQCEQCYAEKCDKIKNNPASPDKGEGDQNEPYLYSILCDKCGQPIEAHKGEGE